jgi:hypothetical protein
MAVPPTIFDILCFAGLVPISGRYKSTAYNTGGAGKRTFITHVRVY